MPGAASSQPVRCMPARLRSAQPAAAARQHLPPHPRSLWPALSAMLSPAFGTCCKTCVQSVLCQLLGAARCLRATRSCAGMPAPSAGTRTAFSACFYLLVLAASPSGGPCLFGPSGWGFPSPHAAFVTPQWLKLTAALGWGAVPSQCFPALLSQCLPVSQLSMPWVSMLSSRPAMLCARISVFRSFIHSVLE